MESAATPIVVEETYASPVAAVWRALVDPAQMRQWFFAAISDFAPKVGFETQFSVRAGGREFLHLWQVTAVEPGRRIAYRWRYAGYPGDSTVSWELAAAPGGTRLKLTHAGIETFPQDDPMFTRAAGQAGWSYFILESLKAFLEGRNA